MYTCVILLTFIRSNYRKDICVPRGGVKDFPPNFYINCIQDELGSKPYFGICDVCDRDWLVSQYRCVNCDLDICKFCIHEHRLFKHDIGHEANIMRIETGNVGPILASTRTCDKHEGEPAQMFCLNCDILCCISCVCESHKKHETMTLGKKLSLAQKHLQFEMDGMKEDVKIATDNLEKLHDTKESIEKEKEACVKAIRCQARDLTMEIDKIAEKKAEHVKKSGKIPLQELETYTKELAVYKDHIERGSRFLEDLEDGDVSLELLDNFKKFQQKTDILKKSISSRTLKYYNVEFTPKPLCSLPGDLKYFKFGTVTTKTKSALYMSKKTSQRTGCLCGLCKKVLRLRNMVLCVLFSIVIFTVGKLSRNIYEETEDKHANIAGLVFFSYISLAAMVAYIKS